MADISSIKLPSGNTYDLKDILARQGIPYGAVDSTSTSTAFTATVDGITSLVDGTCVMLRNGVATSESGFTLNVNSLGAKPVYNSMAAETRDTSIFNVNYTMLFVYDSTRVSGGCWVCYRGYNSNDNTIGYQIRNNSSTLPVTAKTYRYRLLFSGADMDTLVPANTSSSTSSTAAKAVNTTPINPFGVIYFYSYTSAVSANARPSANYLWKQYPLNLGYSFTNATALALTAYLPVYLKCTPQADGSAIMDSSEPIVQALPSSNDGKIYIFLGVSYNATSMELYLEHPVFYHDGTAIRLWTGASGSSNSDLVFTNQTVASSAWSSNSDLDYYGYRAGIPLTGVTASMMPQVTFTDSQLAEYDLAPICQSYAGGVYIYSAEAISEAITIPSIGLIGG